MREPESFSTMINGLTTGDQLAEVSPEPNHVGPNRAVGVPLREDSLRVVQHMVNEATLRDEHGECAPASTGHVRVALHAVRPVDVASETSHARALRAIVENDWLDVVVDLPMNFLADGDAETQLWSLDYDKAEGRKGTVALVDASRSPDDQTIIDIGHLLLKARSTSCDQRVRWVSNESLGSIDVVIERALRIAWTIDEHMLSALDDSSTLASTASPELMASLHKLTATLAQLIGAERHHIPITWFSAIECTDDLQGVLGGGSTHAAAAIVASAARRTSKLGNRIVAHSGLSFVPDPALRTVTRLRLPVGYLALDERGRGRAIDQTAREFAAELRRIEPNAWIPAWPAKVTYNTAVA